MNHWMEIQAPSVTSLSFPGSAGPESTHLDGGILWGGHPQIPENAPFGAYLVQSAEGS